MATLVDHQIRNLARNARPCGALHPEMINPASIRRHPRPYPPSGGAPWARSAG